MNATLAAQAPKFHHLTGTQPVGQRQVATTTDYAGAVTVLYRTAEEYWIVVTRGVRNAFTDRAEIGSAAAIWHAADGRYVVDYYDRDGQSVTADRTRSLGAAIGSAVSVTTRRWAVDR